MSAKYEPEPGEGDPNDATGLTEAAFTRLNDALSELGLFDIEIGGWK